MKKEGCTVRCILVVLCILAIIVLFEKYVISANLQEGATNSNPKPACIPDPNKPKPFNIKVHYSNYNANM